MNSVYCNNAKVLNYVIFIALLSFLRVSVLIFEENQLTLKTILKCAKNNVTNFVVAKANFKPFFVRNERNESSIRKKQTPSKDKKKLVPAKKPSSTCIFVQ